MAIWLYAGLLERLPESARALIASEELRVSPLVSLELAYMHEIGRARDPAPMMLAALRQGTGLEVADVSLAELTDTAVGLTWTRDPFDRMIAAQAILADSPLITADRTILEHLPLATWD
ncbi:MAG TPA: PIN domain-containing protein [Solirubrobacterales bacterium]